MRTVVRAFDSISEYTGKVAKWACLALVLVLVYEVVARYAFNAPTIWAHQTSCMLGGAIAALGWAYTLRHQGHVRVDVLYSHLSPRGQAIIDVLCGLLFFFPLLFILIHQSASQMLYSWSMGEVLTQTYWYPPAGPIRTVVFVGLLLFGLQGVSQFTRDLYFLVRGRTVD